MNSDRKTTVAVVGGTSGIGFATAKKFAEKGFTTYLIGRNGAKCEGAAAKIGYNCQPLAADAADFGQLSKQLNAIGKATHVVLAAGGQGGAGTFDKLSTEELRQAFEEKFWVHWTALKAFAPVIVKNGSVTFITAVRTQMAEPSSVGLAAINGAIEAMVPSLAKEFAPKRINAVAPGVIATPPWMLMDEQQRERIFADIGQRTFVGRVGEPKEVADAVFAIATNPYITGTVLKVDGGFSL